MLRSTRKPYKWWGTDCIYIDRYAIFVFKCGDDYIQYCSDYKYLGLVLNEFLDYNSTAKSVALSANRALGFPDTCTILNNRAYHTVI
jgi:hypothetical protein